jgi:hypothetical protein
MFRTRSFRSLVSYEKAVSGRRMAYLREVDYEKMFLKEIP